MKKGIFILTAALLYCFISNAQVTTPEQPAKKKKTDPKGFGLKAGLNLSDVTGFSDVSTSNTKGFMIGAYFAPPSKKILGFRTEIIYSEQGFNYSNGTTSGKVDLNYILLPQLSTIQITRFVEIHIGMQMAYLLNAKADSTGSSNTTDPYASIMDFTNRFGYGIVGGIQVYPITRIFIGGRFNISMSNLYKTPDYSTGIPPTPGIPSASDINLKNNVVQIFAGIRL